MREQQRVVAMERENDVFKIGLFEERKPVNAVVVYTADYNANIGVELAYLADSPRGDFIPFLRDFFIGDFV